MKLRAQSSLRSSLLSLLLLACAAAPPAPPQRFPNELVEPPMSLRMPAALDCAVLARELSALRLACWQEQLSPRGDCQRFDHCPNCTARDRKKGEFDAAGCKE